MSKRASIRLIAAMLGSALAAGCIALTPADPVVSQPASSSAFGAAELFGSGPANNRTSPPMRIVVLGMDVVRVELAADDVRDARKVWNHVDELRLGAEHSVLLARNGLRMAVGSPESWAAIRAIMDTSKAQVEQETLISQANMPLTLTLGQSTEGESIFIYLGPGRLTGRSFPAAEKLLTLDYRTRHEAGDEVDLRLTFEVREDLGVMAWEKINGAIREVPAYNRHTFEELSTLATMRPGEFLAIGLGEGMDKPNLLGNRFLTTEQAGRTRELLLFLTPRLMERQAPAGSAATQP